MKNLKLETTNANFWENNTTAQIILKKISKIEKEIENWNLIDKNKEECEILFSFYKEESTESILNELEAELNKLSSQIDEIEIKIILGNDDDVNDAILTIHPGAGGTESQDWAEMLYRMYIRWVERKNFKFSIIDFQPGDEAGIKDVTIEINGDYAYGLLKAEVGVHRLVRISPYDSSSRRHTSFASVFVYPSTNDDEIDINIKPDEIRIDTYRASGAGGQHVNKTDSAVRITHIETKIVVQCQNERSQHKNKATALKILKAKLKQIKIEEQSESIKELENQKTDIGWGSQIRSYVFHPYTLVKDHRTKFEVGDGKKILDGDLDQFIKSYLLAKSSFEYKN